jgi:hypothetical protein
MAFPILDINGEISRFKQHLEEENNSRILFSGIFGIGKTFFIKKFFENDENYISIKLNPVNYSVSANQDIFELIKFDIAFQLLSKNPKFEKETFDKLFAGQFYLLENYKRIIGDLMQNLSKIDHRINSIVEPAFKLGKQIKEYQEETIKDDEKELKGFLEFFKDQKGTIREENNITELISALISSLKDEDNAKEIVLIIDDLDRIDPEHIFRLLNVFSAHFDFQELEGENKFGFDKVIIICDIENIRGIFHNKYGAEIDFSGYIDKFYTNEIYYYKIENVIKENLKHFISLIKSDNNIFVQQQNALEGYVYNDLKFLLSFFVDSNAINLRSLLAFLNQVISFPNYSLMVNKAGYNRISSNSTPIIFVMETLEKLFGGKLNLLKAIDKVIEKHPIMSLERYGNFTESSIGNLAMLADNSETQLITSVQSEHYTYDILDYRIEYIILSYNLSYGVIGHLKRISPIKSNGDPTATINHYILPYFQLFKKAYIAKSEIIKKIA